MNYTNDLFKLFIKYSGTDKAFKKSLLSIYEDLIYTKIDKDIRYYSATNKNIETYKIGTQYMLDYTLYNYDPDFILECIFNFNTNEPYVLDYMVFKFIDNLIQGYGTDEKLPKALNSFIVNHYKKVSIDKVYESLLSLLNGLNDVILNTSITASANFSELSIISRILYNGLIDSLRYHDPSLKRDDDLYTYLFNRMGNNKEFHFMNDILFYNLTEEPNLKQKIDLNLELDGYNIKNYRFSSIFFRTYLDYFLEDLEVISIILNKDLDFYAYDKYKFLEEYINYHKVNMDDVTKYFKNISLDLLAINSDIRKE